MGDILNAIADNKTLALFHTIRLADYDSNLLVSKLKISRKQYYLRISRLTKAGLVRRHRGKYILTMFGKIVYEAEGTIEKAVDVYPKLKVVNMLEMSTEIPTDERYKIINVLLDIHGIRKIFFPNESNPQKNPNEIKRT